jgi:hypothetical protein
MNFDRLLAVSAGFLAATSLVVFTVISFLLYSRLRSLGEKPRFSMLSVPGYLTQYCKRASRDLDERCNALIHSLAVSQYILLGTWSIFLVLLAIVH